MEALGTSRLSGQKAYQCKMIMEFDVSFNLLECQMWDQNFHQHERLPKHEIYKNNCHTKVDVGNPRSINPKEALVVPYVIKQKNKEHLLILSWI